MINNHKVMAIVPARAGSKRVKNKNTRKLLGKPLIQWTIDAGLKSKYIDQIYVSTDSKEIQELAISLNVSCENLRPSYLSTDESSTSDVIVDLIQQVRGYDLLILLQPTSPFRSSKDIDNALEKYFSLNAKSIVSVCPTECHVSWMMIANEDMHMVNINKVIESKRSQDLQRCVQLNGAIFIMSVRDFLLEKTFFLDNGTYAYEMERLKSIDIDTEEDFNLANIFASEYFGENYEP